LPVVGNLLEDADNQLFKSVLTNTEHIHHHCMPTPERASHYHHHLRRPTYIIRNLYPKPVYLMAGPLLYAYCTRISVCNWFVCIYYSASKSDILYVYFYFYVYCAILLCLCCVWQHQNKRKYYYYYYYYYSAGFFTSVYLLFSFFCFYTFLVVGSVR